MRPAPDPVDQSRAMKSIRSFARIVIVTDARLAIFVVDRLEGHANEGDRSVRGGQSRRDLAPRSPGASLKKVRANDGSEGSKGCNLPALSLRRRYLGGPVFNLFIA